MRNQMASESLKDLRPDSSIRLHREGARMWEWGWKEGLNTNLSGWEGYIWTKANLKELDTIPKDLLTFLKLKSNAKQNKVTIEITRINKPEDVA